MRHTKFRALAIAAPLMLVLAGCSAAADEASKGDGASEVKIAFLGDITGPAAFCGGAAKTGFEQAIKRVNENKLAGDVTLIGEIADTATDPKVAATKMASLAGSDVAGVVIGCASGVSQAVTPVAQNAGLPVVAMQSGTPSVIKPGDFIFRTTAPQSTYHDRQVDYYAKKGVKTAAIVYQSDNPTLVGVAEEIYPDALNKAGIKIVATETFLGANFDFASLSSKVVGADPDVIFLLGQGTPNVTISTQLLNQGYKGYVGGSAGFDNGVLKPLGSDANGFTWPTDYNVDNPAQSAQDFVKFYEENVGEKPGAFEAEAWDAVLLLAAGIANADHPTDRSSVRDGIAKATEKGYDGAVGPITFDGRDARIEGLLVEWRDGSVKIVG